MDRHGDGFEGVKVIVFDNAGGQKPPIVNPEAFKVASKDYTKSVLEHPQSATYRDYSTTAIASMCEKFAALTVKNFSRGTFDKVDQVDGDALREFALTRGKPSDPAHACMAGCTIKCSNVFGGEDGKILSRRSNIRRSV